MNRLIPCIGLSSGQAVLVSADALQIGLYLPGIRDANLTEVRVSPPLQAEEVGAAYGLKARTFMYEGMVELHQDALNGKVDMVIVPGMEMAAPPTPEELTQGFDYRELVLRSAQQAARTRAAGRALNCSGTTIGRGQAGSGTVLAPAPRIPGTRHDTIKE